MLLVPSYSCTIAFAEEAQSVFSSTDITAATTFPESFVDKFEKTVHGFPNNLGPAAAAHYGDLDGCGTSLWNLCTRLRRGFDASENRNKRNRVVLLLSRIYSFFLLDSAQNSGRGTKDNAVRCMKVALKVGRNCLGEFLFSGKQALP